MSLEGLLTYVGLLVAALAIMSPVQRRSLGLFIPKWFLPISIVIALLFLVVRDMPLGLPPPFGWRLDLVTYFLTVGAFLIPVLAALLGWWRWYTAKLTSRSMPLLESFFQGALRESVFDEVERVVHKNGESLASMPASAASALFNPRMVKHLTSSHSFIHLELLAHQPLLESLENRLQAVEVVVREIISTGSSPLQAAVVKRYGGIEHLQFTDAERKLIKATFQNPEWYHDTNAHYPLTVTAINKIQSGELDDAYNTPDENYVSNQGVSRRATCPVYLAIKTEVLAIEAALKAGVEEDFYVSDLFDILRNIFQRSKFDSSAFSVRAGFQADYTPYSYLVEVITSDLETLVETAVQQSVKNNSASPEQSAPGRVGNDLVRMWAFCIWWLMTEPDKIDPVLRERIIVERYFRFLFALGWEPSEILRGAAQGVNSLNRWRDTMLKELEVHFPSPCKEPLNVIKRVLDSLDTGKRFISDGYDWLKTKFPSEFLPH
jgi:hypothetical protein